MYTIEAVVLSMARLSHFLNAGFLLTRRKPLRLHQHLRDRLWPNEQGAHDLNARLADATGLTQCGTDWRFGSFRLDPRPLWGVEHTPLSMHPLTLQAEIGHARAIGREAGQGGHRTMSHHLSASRNPVTSALCLLATCCWTNPASARCTNPTAAGAPRSAVVPCRAK